MNLQSVFVVLSDKSLSRWRGPRPSTPTAHTCPTPARQKLYFYIRKKCWIYYLTKSFQRQATQWNVKLNCGLNKHLNVMDLLNGPYAPIAARHASIAARLCHLVIFAWISNHREFTHLFLLFYTSPCSNFCHTSSTPRDNFKISRIFFKLWTSTKPYLTPPPLPFQSKPHLWKFP